MVRYDPNVSPDPAAWQALDESAALVIVERHHRSASCAHPPAPNPRLHAVMHVIVENQVAMGDELLAAATLRRLMAEGLTRHEAVHAIGSVVAEHLHTILKEGGKGIIPDSDAALRALSADSWRHSGPTDPDDQQGDAGVGDGRKGPANRDDIVAPFIAKVGRNDPCPCGSGKKYKKCCLPSTSD